MRITSNLKILSQINNKTKTSKSQFLKNRKHHGNLSLFGFYHFMMIVDRKIKQNLEFISSHVKLDRKKDFFSHLVINRNISYESFDKMCFSHMSNFRLKGNKSKAFEFSTKSIIFYIDQHFRLFRII